MGRGNFCYDDGIVVYVDLKVDEAVEEEIKEREECNETYNEERLYEIHNDILLESLVNDLELIANKKKKNYYKIEEYDVYNKIKYVLVQITY